MEGLRVMVEAWTPSPHPSPHSSIPQGHQAPLSPCPPCVSPGAALWLLSGWGGGWFWTPTDLRLCQWEGGWAGGAATIVSVQPSEPTGCLPAACWLTHGLSTFLPGLPVPSMLVTSPVAWNSPKLGWPLGATRGF